MSTNNLSLVPSSVILSPNDSVNNLNLLDFSNIGSHISSDSMAFKKIQNFSKLNSQYIFSSPTNYYSKFNKINSLYINEASIDNINPSVSIFRQHNYTSIKTSLNMFSTLIDNKSFKKFFNYSSNLNDEEIINFNLNSKLNSSYETVKLFNIPSQNILESITLHNNKFFNEIAFFKFLNNFNFTYSNEHFLGRNNILLEFLPSIQKGNSTLNSIKAGFKEHDFNSYLKQSKSLPSNLYPTNGDFFKITSLKSSGQSISTQEKSLRDLNKLNPNLSFQNNFLFFKKNIFNDTLNKPLFNTLTYDTSNLG